MNRWQYWLLGIGLLLVSAGAALFLVSPTTAASPQEPDSSSATIYDHGSFVAPVSHVEQGAASFMDHMQMAGVGCEVTAVSLIGAWVDAELPEGEFPFESLNGEACTGDFEADVLPLFTEEDIWFEGSQACTECHFDNSEDSRHEMDLSSYAGIMRGGDVLSEPPGVQIVDPGDWEHSKLRARLRDNRMPPGWEFDIEETNRDGPLMSHDGGDIYAVSMIGAWVDAGVPEGAFAWTDEAGNEHEGDFAADVLPLFTEEDIWFEGSQACTECHFDNSEDSRHEMDLSSYAGIMLGGDVLSEPPGVQIVIPGSWDDSKLRARLRDNRMPPGWEFDIEETNRDGPVIVAGELDKADDFGNECDVYAVDLIGAWVDAGVPETFFPFIDANGDACQGDFTLDVLPLFIEEDVWFEGSQSCVECHFDNSEDSRHEMDLSSYEGIMRGGDVLSEPPGVQIVVPGNWDDSKLRARLRNNRMPPGWEFDIEETNRDGPLMSHDGGDIYAVSMIGAWVDAGVPEGAFAWTDEAGNEHEGDFEADVLPLFTEEDIWFEGSQACTECHFDNSEDSRHEMDLSSYAGIMLGGDVLSEPPGVQIVLPGNWDDSKLRARMRNNRMPPGWEFDIEETNRDGPMIFAGSKAEPVLISAGDACGVYAVDVIGAWVDAGVPEGSFTFTSVDGVECASDFETAVLPLFTEENIWFEGSQSCVECHFDNSEDSRHEMDMSSYAGIMLGGDVLSEPPGVQIVLPGDWEHSKLRTRLRDNRMPPGWEFDIEETNRDGPMMTIDGGEIYAVDLIGAWVDAGLSDGAFPWADMSGAEHEGDFDTDVLPLFTEENIWFEGSQSCVECHFDNSEDSRHEMDLSSYEGLMLGGDVLSEPPGVQIVVAGDWEHSKLRSRLRDNRMPPGWEFDIEETNRDGPMIFIGAPVGSAASADAAMPTSTVLSGDCEVYAVDLIGAWVDAGATESDLFAFADVNGRNCQGEFEHDVLPLFTEENAWFSGSQSCVECHFDNSEDSRHEMDLSSFAGLMLGGDVLSEPPGVQIVIPGDWDHSKLRARLRDNRMPPGWEFDIEETNRDGPMMSLDGGEIYAVDLIGAWVDAGIPDGAFTWMDMNGNEHEGDFDADVLPLFTEENIWFEGSQSCVECHFDNSEDSRHEMDLSSYEGLMLGGDVLSEPPGVAIVVSGDWEHSKLRSRLRDNRMPPGWEFDIEETNRDGPLVMAGTFGEAAAAESGDGDSGGSSNLATSAPAAPPLPDIPDSTITESVEAPFIEPVFLAILGGLTIVFGIVLAVVMINRLRADDRQSSGLLTAVDVSLLLFTLLAVGTGGLAFHAGITDELTTVRTIREEVPFVVEVSAVAPTVAEVRVEEWQANIPESYTGLENPYIGDAEAVSIGQDLYFDNNCYHCHGGTLTGDGEFSPGLTPKPVNLTDPALMSLPFMTDNYLYWRISDGGASPPFLSAMPAWHSMLTEDERWQLVTYIRSQTSDVVFDEGEQAAIAIIEQAGCFACHRSEVLGRGGKIGPGWDELNVAAGERVPGMSAETYVRESIVNPVELVSPGFEDKATLMPADFGERLSEEEIDILVEFLLHLGVEDGSH